MTAYRTFRRIYARREGRETAAYLEAWARGHETR